MEALCAEFARRFGRPPERVVRAPGRVNLIGEHTDYNEGLVLPFAVDRTCVVAARPATSVRVRSLDSGDTVELPADGLADPAGIRPAWGRYVGGVVRELAALGRAHVGIDAVLASDVPLGAGLSSSAALEVAVATALCDAAGLRPGRLELGPMAMTRAMCAPGSLDHEISKRLFYVRSYVMKDGRLFLSMMADGGVFELEPLP